MVCAWYASWKSASCKMKLPMLVFTQITECFLLKAYLMLVTYKKFNFYWISKILKAKFALDKICNREKGEVKTNDKTVMHKMYAKCIKFEENFDFQNSPKSHPTTDCR